MNKALNILPKKPLAMLGYDLDFLIAFLPCILFSALFISPSILWKMALLLLCALAFELTASVLLKKELDLTIIARGIAVAILIPQKSPTETYLILGAILGILCVIRLFIEKHLSVDAVTLCIAIGLLIARETSPAVNILGGTVYEDISVLDLILGTKAATVGSLSLVCLLFAFVFLAIKKRIRALEGILFYSALILIIGFLYSGYEQISALHFVSFIALDGQIFASCLILSSLGGAFPSHKKLSLAFSVLGGIASGYALLSFGSALWVPFVIVILSLISRPVDLLCAKLLFRTPAKKG